MRRLMPLLLVLTLGCRTTAPAQTPTQAPPLWELRTNPLIDLHAWMRALVYRPAERPDIPGLEAAVQAVRKLGSPPAWGIYDGALIEADSVEGFAKLASELPEAFEPRSGGRSMPMRAPMEETARAYAAIDPAFREKIWPEHRRRIERVEAYLRTTLLPRSREVFADLERSLDAPSPASPIPVYVVAVAPLPQAFTFRSQAGPFSVLAFDGDPRTQWLEIVIHESIHSLDVMAGERSVLAGLRTRLEKVPGASPQEIHDFVHTLMFAQAAGTVRKVFDPGHKDYGDIDGYYPKVPRAAAVVVPAWREYLEGRISREAALDRIVEGFAKEKGGP
ncbi:MAG: hypothetical protein ACJ75H_11890 [Thermoanaerobaculia bacterium]